MKNQKRVKNFQGLCKLKLEWVEWDEKLNERFRTEWEALIQSLRLGFRMKWSRGHAFSDASVEFYGASVQTSV